MTASQQEKQKNIEKKANQGRSGSVRARSGSVHGRSIIFFFFSCIAIIIIFSCRHKLREIFTI